MTDKKREDDAKKVDKREETTKDLDLPEGEAQKVKGGLTIMKVLDKTTAL